MSIDPRNGFIGLVTNAAALMVPPGTLQEAENVVMRRAQSLEPRDGVTLESSMNGTEVWGASFDVKDIYARYSGGTFTYRSTAGDTYQYYDITQATSINPQPLRRDVLTAAQARGNLYLPFDAGVTKLVPGGSAFGIVGIPIVFSAESFSPYATTGTVWLANNSTVAYRVVATATDASGVVRRSAPTGAITITNATGSTCSPQLLFNSFVSLPVGTITQYELYRTRAFTSGVQVDDEMQLVAVLPFGTSTYIDRVAENARGATLYTSPSRGGITQMNTRPPAAACVATFKGSLFFGNTRGPQFKKFSRTWANNVSGSATGVGYRSATGTVNSASPTVTSVTPTTGLEKGMYEALTGRYITNISGSTITLSGNAGVTGVGAALTFYDAVKVGASSWTTTFDGSTLAAGIILFGTPIYEAYSVTPPEGGSNGTFVVSTISRAAGSLGIQATHGSEYSPQLPNYDGTPLELDQDIYPGALYWSKKDEPEHVAPAAFAFVGDSKKAILGLVPTRDALFVLKEDGVFRLTGNGATEGEAAPWRIDPYDPTLFCILPNSVKALAERAYFMSNKGIIAFSDAGSEIVSSPINDLVKPVIDGVLSGWRSSGLYELPNLVGSFAAVYERENEYTILRSGTDPLLVFNQNTSAWTTWNYVAHATESLAPKAVFYFERAGRVIYALGSASYRTVLSTDSILGSLVQYPRFDRETAVTANSWTAGTSTVVLSAPRTALKDDVIQDAAGVLWRITADVVAGTSFVVAPLTAANGSALSLTTGSCVLYRSLRCKVTPQVFTAPVPAGKVWRSLTPAFERFDGPVILRFAYNSAETARSASAWDEEDSVLVLTNGRAVYPQGYSYTTVKFPNAHMRAWAVKASVRWAMTHGEARLEGIFVDSEPVPTIGNQQRAL